MAARAQDPGSQFRGAVVGRRADGYSYQCPSCITAGSSFWGENIPHGVIIAVRSAQDCASLAKVDRNVAAGERVREVPRSTVQKCGKGCARTLE